MVHTSDQERASHATLLPCPLALIDITRPHVTFMNRPVGFHYSTVCLFTDILSLTRCLASS